MLRWITLLLLVCQGCISLAQNHYLLGPGGVRLTAAPWVAFGGMGSRAGVQPGGGLALVLGGKVLVGGYGQWLSNHPAGPTYLPTQQPTELRFTQGGVWLGYLFTPQSTLHFTANLRLGWGMAKLTPAGASDPTLASSHVTTTLPTLGLEINLRRKLRLGGELGYRFANGVTLPGLGNSDFEGLVGLLYLKLGRY